MFFFLHSFHHSVGLTYTIVRRGRLDFILNLFFYNRTILLCISVRNVCLFFFFWRGM